MTQTIDRTDQVAVITGAASGIGAGLAREASRRGMKVVLADRDAEGAEKVAQTLAGESLAMAVDVTDLAAVEALAARAWERFGRVDLLFNNAGVMATGLMWEIDPARWQQSIDVNVGGVLNGIRAFVPRMIAAGSKAHIVNTASVGGFLPSPLMAPYSATKFAVVGLTESLRGELEIVKAPIGVSLLAPGPVKSEIFADPFGSDIRPETQHFVEVLRTMLSQHGLEADEFAQRVFDGLDAGLYWLIPQPEALDAALQARTEMILKRETPGFPTLG